MTNAQDLAHTAKQLKQLYIELDSRKGEKAYRPRPERKMKPHLGPLDPCNVDLISIESQLIGPVREDTPQGFPAGLKHEVELAKKFTSRRLLPLLNNGIYICQFVQSAAMEIADNSLNTQSLMRLMLDQQAFLTKALTELNPAVQIMKRKGIKPHQAWGTAAQLAPLASKYTGELINRKNITKLGERNKIRTKTNDQDQKLYNLGDIITHINNQHDQQ